MRKSITITKASWGGHYVEVANETGGFLKEYATTKKITDYDEAQIAQVAKIIDVDVSLLNTAIENAKIGKSKSTGLRGDLGPCLCGCGGNLQKRGKKFMNGHYNTFVQKLRKSLRADSTKEDRDWAKARMLEAGFTERNLFVGGKLPKEVILD